MREERVDPPHRPVPDHLRDDRGRRDRRAALVAVNHRKVVRSSGTEPEAVHEAGLSGRRQGAQTGAHALEVRSMEPVPVDFRR